MRMQDTDIEYDTEITPEEFFNTLQKFKSKKSVAYNFIVNAGLQFQVAVFKLCKRFLYSEEFPESFDITTLIQLPKKGSQMYLDNSRFIHLKLWMPRLCEALTVERMKEDIIAAGSYFQIGGCPGRRFMLDGRYFGNSPIS